MDEQETKLDLQDQHAADVAAWTAKVTCCGRRDFTWVSVAGMTVRVCSWCRTLMGGARKSPYQLGFEDGADAYRSSGSTAEPVNGWDGDLINAVGADAVRRLFGIPPAGDEDAERLAMDEYVRGCRDGAAAEKADAS